MALAGLVHFACTESAHAAAAVARVQLAVDIRKDVLTVIQRTLMVNESGHDATSMDGKCNAAKVAAIYMNFDCANGCDVPNVEGGSLSECDMIPVGVDSMSNSDGMAFGSESVSD